jgi:hypothetical protein
MSVIAVSVLRVLGREDGSGVGVDHDPGVGAHLGWLASVDDHARRTERIA